MVQPQLLLPFWQEKSKAFSRINKSNNDNGLMRPEGINALRADTRPRSLTLFALDRAGSVKR